MALALADAGADIIGVSSSLLPRGVRSKTRCPVAGQTFDGNAVDFADRAAVDELGRRLAGEGPTSSSTTPGRSSARPPSNIRGRGGTASSRSTSSSQFVLTQAVAPANARARARQDHLHRLAADLPGRHHRARIHRGEVRHRRADQGARERMGAARRQRQRHRARLHRHRQHGGAAADRTALARSSSGSRRGAGAKRPTSGAPRLPRLARVRLRHGHVLPVDGGWLGR